MRRNWPREGRQPVRDAGGPVREAPVPPGAGEAKSDPIPSASLTGLRTQITRPPSDFCRFALPP